jgi:hypothetical protein
MLKDASELMSGFFSGLDIKRRWFILFSILLITILGLYIYEAFTGYYYYFSLERKITLLSKLEELSKSGIAANPDLYPIFKNTVRELESKEIKPLLFNLPTKIAFSSILFWKMFSGSFIGLFFLIVTLLGLMGTESPQHKRNMILGSILFLIAGGILGALIPVIYNEWVNYISLPLIIFVGLMIYGVRKK